MLHHFHFLTNLGRQTVHVVNHAKGAIDIGLLRLRGTPQGHLRRLRSSKSPVLIHYHIFKNAGTSFEWALEEAFGRRFRTFDKESAGAVLSAKEIADFLRSAPEAEAVSSHQATLPAPNIRGRNVITSILIRDPIARIHSIYAFERRQDVATPGARKAKELDFKGYVEWRLATTPVMLCNFQVHFCSRTPRSSSSTESGEIQLQRAIANLDEVDIVGTVARYQEWLALAQSVLSKVFPQVVLVPTRRNVTNVEREGDKEAAILDHLVNDLGQPLAEELLKRNELDMCLHQVADALLTRGLAENGVGIALANAYADARQRLPAKEDGNSLGNP